ncbi:S1C family serine protease [Paenibacillus humicola]|uniref:S1C family serine protease n=1 Tax=Paenibacillus humicola TaxID=3110540 RepID=UPI00237C48AB|nr:trypsin-like peptidase domain-containing protein [Paenibacillus humicola]
MDDQNKKHPFDDFFQTGGQSGKDEHYTEQDRSGGEDHKEEASGQEAGKSSYYYSYGPFKPGEQQMNAERDQAGSAGPVEMTPPQLRAFAPTQPSRSGWQVKEPRRTSFRAMFSSFLAGVVIVGGLMFAADRGNWFTFNQSLAATASNSSGGTSASGGGNVSTAADVVRPNNIAQIFQQASPAVVKIETYQNQQQQSGNQGSEFFNDPFFRQFFGDNYGDQGQGNNGGDSGQGSNNLVETGLGSGFFFDSNGYILTNEHVIDGADQIKVVVQGKSQPLVAKKLGSSYDLDLAVLKVEGTGFPTLPIGNSNNSAIGDWVVAIGNPDGFDHTVTVGVLSAKERPLDIPDNQGTRHYQHLLQTDASINPGNSGGPLINMNGEVIGINTAVSTQAQGIGFAIPSSTIQDVLDNLKANKPVPKTPQPFIGATLGDITPDIQQQLGLSDTDGAIVVNVLYKTPAYNADLRQYDIITGIDGTKYSAKEDMIAYIQKKKVGDKITLNVIRNGKTMDLTVTIGDKNQFPQAQQQ